MVRFDFSILSPAFNAFVAVLVQIGKVLPKFLICSGNRVPFFERSKFAGQVANSVDVELVLVRLGWQKVSVVYLGSASLEY